MTEQPIPSLNDDPTTWYLPHGDVPDTTDAEFEDITKQDMCGGQFGKFRMDQDNVVMCTRPDGHDGSHVAGDGDRIVVLWDEPTYRIREDPF